MFPSGSYLGEPFDRPDDDVSGCPPAIALEVRLGGKGPLPGGVGWFWLYDLSLWLTSLDGTPACIACIAVPPLESLLDGIPPIEEFDDSLRSLYWLASRVAFPFGGWAE